MNNKKNILKGVMASIYFFLSLFTPLMYFPKSVVWFDSLYDFVKFGEHSLFTLIRYEIIFATFMLFLACLLKENNSSIKVLWIYFLNIAIPIVGLFALKTVLSMFVLVAYAVIVVYTIQSALNISIKISVAKENKTEAEASE